ncbi:MFS transporter [Pseudonocardia sp. HH130630-07]|uniref:MFS transporter n=1 Tax=Pseudonocardia sp. HH130630-07 TaxID=1690815 RepID=UPI000AD63C33|nr:MFS transporter [Pseudonocardia sp. HH130630-07]
MSEAVQDVPPPGSAGDRAAPSSERESEPHPHRHVVFAVVSVALLMFSQDQTAVATALTTVSRDLQVDLAWTGWIVTIYAVGQILALPLGGRLADAFGSRRVFLTSVGAFTVLSCLCAVAGGIGPLIACRFLQGVAGGVMLPAANGIVAHHYGRDRDRALASFTSVFPIGAILGPLVGGLILTVWSWHAIFLVNVPLGLVVVGVAALVVQDAPRRRPDRVDLRGITLLLLTLVSAMVAITALGTAGGAAGLPVTVAAAVVTVAGGWAFARHSRRRPDAVVPWRLVAGRGLGIMNVTNVLFGAAVIGFSALLPLYAQTRYGLAPFAAGALLTGRAAGTIASSGVSVALLRRTGHRPLLLGGMMIIVLGLLLSAAPATWTTPEVWLLVAATVLGIGMGLTGPAANNAGMHLVPGDVTAVAGLRIMFRQIGGIAAVSATTAAIAASSDPGTAGAVAIVVLAGLLAAVALLAARIPNQRGRW